MKPKQLTRMLLSSVLALAILVTGTAFSSENRVSGLVLDGYRILDIQSGKDAQNFTAYRGDYIKFNLPKEVQNSNAVFPTLKENKPLTHEIETTAYFKMKQTGVYPFSIGSLKGQIRVIEYQQAKYRELSAREADRFITAHTPAIFDVRTQREYNRGHLENSILIPVQVLQKRMGELKRYKNQTVLVYCATGNRSTVASKILIDAGFTDIINLRQGISDWSKKHYPIVQ